MSGDIQTEMIEYIKEYFSFCDLNTTYDTFEKQLKAKLLSQKDFKLPDTQLLQIFKNASLRTKKEQTLQKEFKAYNKKYQQVLQAGRQIFSISINILQLMNSLREVGKLESLATTIENYKIQLGKHHKIIINEGKLEGQELITEATILEHKQKLEQNYNEKNIEGMIEFLLSLRVNALQIAPELRKNLVKELVRRDIFKIYETEKFDFVIEVLNIKNKALRHAMTSLISVICSTTKGVQYITYNNNDVVLQKIFKILKEQENGNVTQRFCLAILQKCSMKQSLIPVYIDQDIIGWTISLIKKSLQTKIHPFCLDFSTAMLANILHSRWCLSYLEKKSDYTLNLMESILRLINQNLPVSVLMHFLICLSFLNKKQFRKQVEESNLASKISDFATKYSYSKSNDDNDMAEIDKKTVLDLCSHMFHVREDGDEVDPRENKRDQEQGELIFQCFQDEVN